MTLEFLGPFIKDGNYRKVVAMKNYKFICKGGSKNLYEKKDREEFKYLYIITLPYEGESAMHIFCSETRAKPEFAAIGIHVKRGWRDNRGFRNESNAIVFFEKCQPDV